MTVLCPRQTPKLSRLTASPQVLITAGTRIMTCVSRLFHVCCTSLPRVPPVVVRGLKFWAVQNFLPRPTPFRFFPASFHVYKSTVARLKLDINANNIVCFTGGHFLTGFGRDQAVKRCVTGPLPWMTSDLISLSLATSRRKRTAATGSNGREQHAGKFSFTLA